MPALLFRNVLDPDNLAVVGIAISVPRGTITLTGRAPTVATGTGDATTFEWDAVSGAASYQLEIGTFEGGSDYSVTNVGNVLTYDVELPAGTYYARVRAVIGGVAQMPSAEFHVVVP